MWKQVIGLSVLAVFVIFAHADDFTDDAAATRVFENQILALLEEVRLRMCYDDPSFLPQLEPFFWEDRLNINIDDEIGKIDAHLEKIKAEGISGFIVDALNFALTLRFSFTIRIPKLILSGNYGIKGDLAGFLTLDGEDKFRLELDQVSIKASAAFLYQEGLYLKNLTLDPTIEAVRSNIENLTGDEEVNEFINHVVGELLPYAFERYIPPETLQSLIGSIETLVSSFTQDMTSSDLIALITGGGSMLPPLEEEKACKVGNGQIEDLTNNQIRPHV